MNATELPAVLGKVLLVTGKEEFLNERTIAAVRRQVRAVDGEAELADASASQLTLAALGELAAPSLFSTTRCVVVRGLEDLPEESHEGLLSYATAPADDIALVLAHSGGMKGSGLLTKLRKLPATVEVKSEEVKAHELARFVTGEFRSAGAVVEDDAAAELVQAIGHDLRALSAAAHQLIHDFPSQRLTKVIVSRYFGGRAEAKSFAVADATLFGRRVPALEELRWALDSGTAPVLVTSAFASGVRGLAKFIGAPKGQRDGDLAALVGVPPWKLKTVRDQARGWDADSIAEAVRLVARADAEVKGKASDASYTLERLVLSVAALRVGR